MDNSQIERLEKHFDERVSDMRDRLVEIRVDFKEAHERMYAVIAKHMDTGHCCDMKCAVGYALNDHVNHNHWLGRCFRAVLAKVGIGKAKE